MQDLAGKRKGLFYNLFVWNCKIALWNLKRSMKKDPKAYLDLMYKVWSKSQTHGKYNKNVLPGYDRNDLNDDDNLQYASPQSTPGENEANTSTQ